MVPSPSHRATPHFAEGNGDGDYDVDGDGDHDVDGDGDGDGEDKQAAPESQADVQNSSTTSSCRPSRAKSSLSSDHWS